MGWGGEGRGEERMGGQGREGKERGGEGKGGEGREGGWNVEQSMRLMMRVAGIAMQQVMTKVVFRNSSV